MTQKKYELFKKILKQESKLSETVNEIINSGEMKHREFNDFFYEKYIPKTEKCMAALYSYKRNFAVYMKLIDEWKKEK